MYMLTFVLTMSTFSCIIKAGREGAEPRPEIIDRHEGGTEMQITEQMIIQRYFAAIIHLIQEEAGQTPIDLEMTLYTGDGELPF